MCVNQLEDASLAASVWIYAARVCCAVTRREHVSNHGWEKQHNELSVLAVIDQSLFSSLFRLLRLNEISIDENLQKDFQPYIITLIEGVKCVCVSDEINQWCTVQAVREEG